MKKGFKILGMLVSIGLVVVGVLAMIGTFAPSKSYPSSSSITYDSGFASFGADFYSFVNNNAAEAASAASAAAYNAADIIDLISSGCGLIVTALGLLGFCFFGMMPTGAFKIENVVYTPAAAPVPAPVQPPVYAPVQAPVAESVQPEEEPIAVPEAAEEIAPAAAEIPSV